jgi:hypothetical protein
MDCPTSFNDCKPCMLYLHERCHWDEFVENVRIEEKEADIRESRLIKKTVLEEMNRR